MNRRLPAVLAGRKSLRSLGNRAGSLYGAVVKLCGEPHAELLGNLRDLRTGSRRVLRRRSGPGGEKIPFGAYISA